MIIREATINDLPTLLQFEQEIITAERPFDSTLGADPISYYDLKEMIENDRMHVVVAEINGELVASGYAKFKDALHYLDHKEYAYLGFMYVKPEYRGQGINAKIIEPLKAWAQKHGLKEIRLTVYDDNIQAIKAYEKAGFKKHLVEMRLA